MIICPYLTGCSARVRGANEHLRPGNLVPVIARMVCLKRATVEQGIALRYCMYVHVFYFPVWRRSVFRSEQCKPAHSLVPLCCTNLANRLCCIFVRSKLVKHLPWWRSWCGV